jgi:hypothetical protein
MGDCRWIFEPVGLSAEEKKQQEDTGQKVTAGE